MRNQDQTSPAKKVFTPSWGAFYLYYVAMAICWFGPQLNPEFARRIFLTPNVGLLLGLVLLAAVFYLRFGQQYEMDAQGVRRVQRFPARVDLLPWGDIRSITVRVGLTQTLLGVGNIVIQPHHGEEMVWYGVESPKLVRNLLERALDEFTTR